MHSLPDSGHHGGHRRTYKTWRGANCDADRLSPVRARMHCTSYRLLARLGIKPDASNAHGMGTRVLRRGQLESRTGEGGSAYLACLAVAALQLQLHGGTGRCRQAGRQAGRQGGDFNFRHINVLCTGDIVLLRQDVPDTCNAQCLVSAPITLASVLPVPLVAPPLLIYFRRRY